MNLQVGQKLWFVPTYRYGQPCEVEVVSIGRKWVKISLGDTRIDINTGHADGRGYCSPGRCWESQEIYKAHVARIGAWSRFRSAIQGMYSTPEHLSTDDIRAAAKLLRIEIDPTPDKGASRE